jgi:membrane protease YdiL (CAAX protease family)
MALEGTESRAATVEAFLVVAIGVGLAAARSAISLVADLTAPGGLRARSATLNGSLAPGRPWIDLGLQLTFIASLLLPALLAAQLGGLRAIGLRRVSWRRDIALGVGIAATVGGLGLGCYLLSYAAGYSVTVVPAALPDVWWRGVVLALSAAANATLEEVVLVGYLLHRCRQLGWSDRRAALLSSGIRGAYHLYQGLAGGLGNLVMGFLFARFYQRTNSIVPLVIAHTAIDLAAFFGYTLLAGQVGWLPGH